MDHAWSAFARDASFVTAEPLPVRSLKVVAKHLGVSKASLSTPYSQAAWSDLTAPQAGIVLYRDGLVEFSGIVTDIELAWDGVAVISVEAAGDEQLLADRITFPDPTRQEIEQEVNDYWQPRNSAGEPINVPASTAMLALISDQAGPTCRGSRRVQGLVLDTDPVVGEARSWKALFTNVLDELATMSLTSNLGLRIRSNNGVLTASVVQPRDLAGDVRFSIDMGNLAAFSYRRSAPTLTDAVVAGQGNLADRVRRSVTRTSPEWGRRVWRYIDRRDTSDTTELDQAGADAVADGAPTVSLSVTLRESEATPYGGLWGLGDRVTADITVPAMYNRHRTATVTDIVREVTLELNSVGAETITPTIGTFDASNGKTQTQKDLAAVQRTLGGLIARV